MILKKISLLKLKLKFNYDYDQKPKKIFYFIIPFMLTVLIIAFLIFGWNENSYSKSMLGRFHPLTNQPNLCPYQTPEEWQKFLETYAQNKKWVETCEDNRCDGEYFDFVLKNIYETFDVCSEVFKRSEQIDRCTKNMRSFVPSWLDQHSEDSYGFTLDNHRYLQAQEATDKPQEMMTPPAKLVASFPDLVNVTAAARKNGWKYLTHDSALGGSRTFVLISDPQGRFDQWMLLNFKKDKTIISGTPMSMITVQKKDAAGEKLNQVRLHFRDYTMVTVNAKNNSNVIVKRVKLELHETNNGKCFSCHSGGMRQLIARKTPILEARPVRGESIEYEDENDFAEKRLGEFNRKIRSYGAPDWNGMVRLESHGPALGKAQGCMDCHDGKSRGVLTVLTSHVQLKQKLYHELSMPPDTALTRLLERKEMKNPALTEGEKITLKKSFEIHDALTKDFEDSRFPVLKKWFLETPCF